MGIQQPFRLILGSSSPARRYLLERAGYQFEVQPANIDEPTHAGYPSPRHLVQHIAWLKAAVVVPQVDEGLVLAADTVAWLDGQVLAKPEDEADARRILRFLGGRTHELWTGVCLWRRPDDVQVAWQERTLVHFKALSDAELDAYITSRDWENNAGGYAIKEDGDPYIRIVEGSVSNVIGLPMETLEKILRGAASRPTVTVTSTVQQLNPPPQGFIINNQSLETTMNTKTQVDPGWIDGTRFNENQNKVPWEVLAPHVGKHVAWSTDGTRILASADDLEGLLQQLDALGISGGQFVHDFLDDPNESQLS